MMPEWSVDSWDTHLQVSELEVIPGFEICN